MSFLLLATRFLRPESMRQGDVTVWTNWIREETEAVMKQLDEELEARGDPDDSFNGSANGVYQPLPENFSLPPSVKTPRRQDSSKYRESSQNSQKMERNNQRSKSMGPSPQQMGSKIQTQVARCKSEEHLLESLDPMSGQSNRTNLHVQSQHRPQEEMMNQGKIAMGRNEDVNTPAQDYNLITFTPPPRQRGLQGTTERQQEPKKQRTHRKKKHKGDWTLNQRQFDQNKQQEISHISPVDQINILNTEEPSVSYLQLPIRKMTVENRLCSKCGKPGHWKHYCKAATWCRFCMSETHATQACRRYANFVWDNQIASSRRTTPVQQDLPRGPQQQGMDKRQLFSQPPTQCFQAPVIPPVERRNTQLLSQQQLHVQRSSQDVRMDPCFRQLPPQYSQVQQHRRTESPLIEVNEVGPTIQQCAVPREIQQHTGVRPKQIQQTRTVSQNQRDDDATHMSSQDEDGGDRLPE